MIPIFFVAAFEVYVRRAYRAYTLLSLDYEEGDTLDDGDAPPAVTWRFNLGRSHSPPSTPNTALGYVCLSLLYQLFLTLVVAHLAELLPLVI